MISDKLNSLLTEYCKNVEGVLGAGISSSNGLEISSHFDNNINANMAHAVSSIVYNHTQSLSKRLDFNGYDYNLTFTKDGIIALKKIDKSTLFLVLMKPETDIDLATTQMEDISKKINGLI